MVDGHVSNDGTFVTSYADQGLQRGDGCFEFVRLYGGRYFALDDHLDRLERSAASLQLRLPERRTLEEWFAMAAGQHDVPEPCGVRLVVSRRAPDTDQVRCVLGVDSLPPARQWTMTLVTAPWQPAGEAWELAGAKTLSYAPNMAAARVATDRGFDDAILVDRAGVVLEAPRAAIAWVIAGVVETPSLDLGILDSITRRHVILAAQEESITVVEGTFHADRMLTADEVMGMSTAKEVAPVVEIDHARYPPGEVTKALAEAFRSRVNRLTAT